MSGSALTLTVIGCAAAWTRRPGRASSCYLLELGDEAIALDFGQGAFSALGGTRDPATLRAVLLSHLHPDHLIDIVPLRHYLRFACDPPGHVEIRGPAELAARIDALMGEPEFLGALAGEALAAGRIELGPFAVDVARVTHTDSSHGFRVSVAGRAEGRGLVYSGDCGEARDLLTLMRPGDVLLSEASYGASDVPAEVAHLSATQAASAARDGGANELILTHILDEVDAADALAAALAVFPQTRLAEPGLLLPIDGPAASPPTGDGGSRRP